MDATKMVKLKRVYSVTDLAGEKVMVDFETGKYYMIKGTGSDIWDMIQEDISVGEIVSRLLNEYDVSEDECYRSVSDFLNQLYEAGMID